MNAINQALIETLPSRLAPGRAGQGGGRAHRRGAPGSRWASDSHGRTSARRRGPSGEAWASRPSGCSPHLTGAACACYWQVFPRVFTVVTLNA